MYQQKTQKLTLRDSIISQFGSHNKWIKQLLQYVLPVPEHEVEYEASHCKGNACSIQDGENDSEGKMY